jgi:hypothetical protein
MSQGFEDSGNENNLKKLVEGKQSQYIFVKCESEIRRKYF